MPAKTTLPTHGFAIRRKKNGFITTAHAEDGFLVLLIETREDAETMCKIAKATYPDQEIADVLLANVDLFHRDGVLWVGATTARVYKQQEWERLTRTKGEAAHV